MFLMIFLKSIKQFFYCDFSNCYHFLGVIHMDYNDYIDNSDDDHSYDVEDDDELYNLVVVGNDILYEIDW